MREKVPGRWPPQGTADSGLKHPPLCESGPRAGPEPQPEAQASGPACPEDPAMLGMSVGGGHCTLPLPRPSLLVSPRKTGGHQAYTVVPWDCFYVCTVKAAAWESVFQPP